MWRERKGGEEPLKCKRSGVGGLPSYMLTSVLQLSPFRTVSLAAWLGEGKLPSEGIETSFTIGRYLPKDTT